MTNAILLNFVLGLFLTLTYEAPVPNAPQPVQAKENRIAGIQLKVYQGTETVKESAESPVGNGDVAAVHTLSPRCCLFQCFKPKEQRPYNKAAVKAGWPMSEVRKPYSKAAVKDRVRASRWRS